MNDPEAVAERAGDLSPMTVPHESPLLDKPYFWHLLEQFGDRPALVGEDGEIVSYAGLAARADGMGFHGGERRLVVMEIDNGIAATAAYLGALRAGHAVILSAPGKGSAFDALVECYSPEIVWTVAAGLEERAAALTSPLHPELSVMLSTSGSTGSAKLVRLAGGSVEANARSIETYLGLTADDRAITTLPPSYSYGLSVLNSHLAAGASVILTERSVTDPEFAGIAAARGATSMAGVPYTYELLITSGMIDDLPASMTKLTQAGGRLAPEMVERVRLAAGKQDICLFVMYGQTEATARMAFIPPEMLADHSDCIGQAIPGGRFELIDPDTGAPAQTAGELVYHGPNVMMGYAETREALGHGREIDRLVTGDLAEQAVPGIFRITGRKSRFVKIFGLRIALDEVEREAARRGWTVVVTGDDSKVVIATDDGRDPAPLAAELADHFNLPQRRFVGVALASLPRLPSGKVDYRTILASVPQVEEQAEGDPMDAYAAMLARLARKPAVGDDASFQTFGGDSLNYVEASILLEEALGEAPEGWEAMTLGRLKELASEVGPVELTEKPRRDTHYIHAMRSVAIMMVIGPHAQQVMTDNSGILEYVSFRHVNVMFIFVAGYLFQYLLQGFSYGNYLKIKARTVVLPYLIVSIPATCIYLFGLKDIGDLNAPDWVQGKAALALYMTLTGTQLAPLWFIPMICLVYLAAPLLKVMDERPSLYWALVPLTVLAFYIGRPDDNQNPLQAFVYYLPCYTVGMLVCHYRDRVLPVLAKIWPLLLLPVVIPPLLEGGAAAHENLNMLTKLSVSFGVLGALTIYSRRVPGWFDRIGDLSFGIYFVHGYLAAALSMAARHKHIELQGIVPFSIIFLTILLLSIVIVLVTKQIFGRYSRMIIGA